MAELEARFRAYLVKLIVEWLLAQGGAKLLTTDTVQRTPYGQLTRKRDGELIFTPTQANLVPGLGSEVLVIENKEWQFALGDSGRSERTHVVPSRSGGAFPVPMPYQPVISPAAAEQPLSHNVKGQLEPLTGFVAVPRKDNGIGPAEGPEAQWPYDSFTTKVLKSFPANPAGPLLDFGTDYDLLYQPYPLPRPYHTMLREAPVFGGGVKPELSFVGWAESIFYGGAAVRELPPAEVAASVTIPAVYYITGGGACAELAPARTMDVSIGIVPKTQTDWLTVQHWTPVGNNAFFNAAGQAIEVPYNATYYTFEPTKRFTSTYTYTYSHDTGAQYPGKLPKGNREVHDGSGFCARPLTSVRVTETVTLLVSGAWFASHHKVGDVYEKRYSPGIRVNVNRGASYQTQISTRFVFEEEGGFCEEVAPYWSSSADAYGIGSQGGGVKEIFTDARTFLPADAIKNCYPPVTTTPPLGTLLIDSVRMANIPALGSPGPGPQGSVTKKLTKDEIKVIVSDYFGLPEDLTGTEARAEQFVPWIYDRLSQGNKLRNPLAGAGESFWYGLSWTTPEYVADAFYALGAEGVEHLYGVAITGESEVYTLHVSVDGAPVGSWPVLNLFPGNDGTLYYLDGSSWPPPNKLGIKQHYNFAHAEWPFRDSALLTPFTVRLRGKQDKTGPLECLVVLYLDEPFNPSVSGVS